MSELLTEKWRQDRLGKVTASRIGDMLATTKSGWGASRRNYAGELISERSRGVPFAHYVSPEMRYGIETQDEALGAYERKKGMLVSRHVTREFSL
jgi:hypothetical protein